MSYERRERAVYGTPGVPAHGISRTGPIGCGQNGPVAAELSVEHVASDLRRLGVAKGDLLHVHASLRSIGPVVGGADGVLDAIQQVIGTGGTMMMTLGAHDPMEWVNERPESERAGLLEGSEPFDALTTPVQRDVGVLAEVFRTRRGTLVTDNPEGRFGAWGALASELTVDAPWDDYYGPGSPLERFVDHGGRILRMGANPDTVTLLHYAEYLVPVPDKRRVRRLRMVKGDSGPELRWLECLDDEEGIVDLPGEDYFAIILREHLATGRARTGLVGRAPSELIEGSEILDTGVAWMAEHLT